jgi:hypothetical protein
VVAVLGLDRGVTRMVVVAALAVCFATVSVMLWRERRQGRSVDRAFRPD